TRAARGEVWKSSLLTGWPQARRIVRRSARWHLGDLRPRSRAWSRESNHRGPARSLSGVVGGRTRDRILRGGRYLPRSGRWIRLAPAAVSGWHTDELVARRAHPFFRQSARRSSARAFLTADTRGHGTGPRRRRPALPRRQLARLHRARRTRGSAIFRHRVAYHGRRRRCCATAV